MGTVTEAERVEATVELKQDLDFQPALDYIAVDDQLEEKHGEIYIPPTARRDGHIWGKVLATGPGRSSEYTGEAIIHELGDGEVGVVPCEVGEEVLYSLGAGTKIGDVRFVNPRDILARR